MLDIKEAKCSVKILYEEEYRALTNTSCEAQWLLFLLRDFCMSHIQSIILFCDNKSAIDIVSNPIFHERTNHIEMDCHLVRDKLQTKIIHMMLIKSANQITDLFTKSLHGGPIKIYFSFDEKVVYEFNKNIYFFF